MAGSIGWVALIGGLILVAVLGFAAWRNQQRSGSAHRRTEQATKDLYASVDREDKASDPDTKPY